MVLSPFHRLGHARMSGFVEQTFSAQRRITTRRRINLPSVQNSRSRTRGSVRRAAASSNCKQQRPTCSQGYAATRKRGHNRSPLHQRCAGEYSRCDAGRRRARPSLCGEAARAASLSTSKSGYAVEFVEAIFSDWENAANIQQRAAKSLWPRSSDG